ncbi:proprotein convertase subtilisin/kexin type 5-like [Cebidichthys violaceus]|uniref:proprotein convertase subtilisin/kexin type 5-like n=1 Tax=Cebidichthys violaceus TaxID=271503 RepID=UPI0035C9B47B
MTSSPAGVLDSTCVSECPAGTYDTSQDADGTELGLCLPCDNACSTCSGASPKDCLTCSLGYLRLLQLCVTHCPTRYYREGSHCEKCDQSCEQCTGPGPESCRACLPPLLELQGTKLCVERCPHRFYRLSDICKQCHTSCQTCIDASPQGCMTCDWGSTLKDSVCYPHCEEGQYFSKKETCEPCDSSCGHCTGPRPDQCLTCHRDSALHAVENRCAHCCQVGGNDTDCCVCDSRSALCVEAPQPKSGEDQATDLNMSSRTLKHTSAGLPIALLLALGLALAMFALVKAHARKRLCWGQSYERLSGSASINMPHGVPEPGSGDEVDVVYTSRGGSVYRRYSFIHEPDTGADQDVDESTCLNQF